VKVYTGPYTPNIDVMSLIDVYWGFRYREDYYDTVRSPSWFDSAFIRSVEFVHRNLNDLIQKLFKRKIKVRIDHYDTWGLDRNLAFIIHPALIQLKKNKHGSPFVDDEDVPERIQSKYAAPKKNEYDTDEYFHDRWGYVIDEMIWSFEQLITEDSEDKYFVDGKFDKEGYTVYESRIANGLRLFGKYYRSLWT